MPRKDNARQLSRPQCTFRRVEKAVAVAIGQEHTWYCRHCDDYFTSDDAIRVRGAQGDLLPIHTCMLKVVEFCYNAAIGTYKLASTTNVRPGHARVWWPPNR